MLKRALFGLFCDQPQKSNQTGFDLPNHHTAKPIMTLAF
jgi:hypothetical protein